MTDHKRSSDFLVGATVLIVTAVLVATVLWVKQADLGGRKTDLVVRTRDVGGVALGNPVVVRGVRAGQVKGIALGEKGWVVLQLSIDKAVEMPSRSGGVAGGIESLWGVAGDDCRGGGRAGRS